jgi:hypothetical protein
VITERVVPGPGTVKVARFIGRLGVVSLPAVEVALELDQRVVRRHVAKLEAAGWLARMPWVWGQGSVAWLTELGVERAGLGGVRPIKSPPAPTTIAHAVLVEWSAARAERRGRTWKSTRELALDGERWEVPTRCERGYTTQLPDLAVWLTPAGPPWAVVAESGGRREDRQKLMLEGWRDAVHGGRYAGVRYDCASASVASWIRRLAKKVWLTPPDFSVIVQTTAEEIATLARADAEGEGRVADEPETTVSAAKTPNGNVSIAPADMRVAKASVPEPAAEAERPAPRPETPEDAAERERRYREIFGITEPKRRRRWRC